MTKETLITMSSQELERVSIIGRVIEKSLTQSLAAQRLGISVRQIKRLVRKYKELGPTSLASQKRLSAGRKGFGENEKKEVHSLISSHYQDFGPTLAAEKLQERHHVAISKETLRKWMIEWGLWKSKRRHQARVHQSRDRRACRGELVQIDGSPHAWFESRADSCCLLVFIDDATGELMQLRFEPTETTSGYFAAVQDYLLRHGKPTAWYSDKYGVFRVNKGSGLDEERGHTQFQRAMITLDIEHICANSPQAKGRVERVNQTLQDRLVKELRLRGINSITEANEYLPEFILDFNRRFAVKPASEFDMHREVHQTKEELSAILCEHDTRTLSKNLEFSYENKIYQIKTQTQGYSLRRAKVTLHIVDGVIHEVLYKGKSLVFEKYTKTKKQTTIATRKTVNAILDKKLSTGPFKARKPAANHPWRKPQVNSKGCLPTGYTASVGATR